MRLLHDGLLWILLLLKVCRVVVMIVAGLRCPLVGVLLPLHGVVGLWVLLRDVVLLEIWRCYSACNEYTAIHLLLQSILIYKRDSFQLTRNVHLSSTYSKTASAMYTKDVVSIRGKVKFSTSLLRSTKTTFWWWCPFFKWKSATFSFTLVVIGNVTA